MSKLRPEKQIGDECLIASVAILSGQNYANERRRAHWRLWIERIRAEDHFFWEDEAKAILRPLGFDVDAWEPIPYDTGYIYDVQSLNTRSVTGSGILLTEGKYWGHAAAYVEGTIFDPSDGSAHISVADYKDDWAMASKPILHWAKIPYLRKPGTR